jgi:hypothetical protein
MTASIWEDPPTPFSEERSCSECNSPSRVFLTLHSVQKSLWTWWLQSPHNWWFEDGHHRIHLECGPFYTKHGLRKQFGVSINVWGLAGDTLNITCNFLYCNYQVHKLFDHPVLYLQVYIVRRKGFHDWCHKMLGYLLRELGAVFRKNGM